MKRWVLLTLLGGVWLAAAPAALADANLKVSPQKYEDVLTTTPKAGFIDVANPSDTTVEVVSSVQGFRQDDLAGDLAFFEDDELSAGITVGLTDFSLGPREAVRVTFTVDPSKLPQGGVYAAIFFRTVPPPVSSAATSYIAESANVGTLLMFQNGEGNAVGQVTQWKVPFWQIGQGLTGQAHYTNTNRNTTALAFSPALDLRVFPWGHTTKVTGPYVLPGSTRQFEVTHTGSYIGFIPVTLVDAASGHAVTHWVFALTGWWLRAVVVLVVLLVAVLGWRSWRWLHGRRHGVVKKPSLDGLSRRP